MRGVFRCAVAGLALGLSGGVAGAVGMPIAPTVGRREKRVPSDTDTEAHPGADGPSGVRGDAFTEVRVGLLPLLASAPTPVRDVMADTTLDPSGIGKHRTAVRHELPRWKR